jgi:hypothetical protein
MILKDHGIAKTNILLEVEHPVSVSPEDVLEIFRGKVGEGFVMVGSFDDYLVGSDAVHFVIEPHPFPVQFPLNPQSGEFVRHNPQTPSRTIPLTPFGSESHNLGRSFILVSRAERTKTPLRAGLLNPEVRGSFASLRRNDHPSSSDRVLALLRHSMFLFEIGCVYIKRS